MMGEIIFVLGCVILGILIGFKLGYKNAQEHFLERNSKFYEDICGSCPPTTKADCKHHK